MRLQQLLVDNRALNHNKICINKIWLGIFVLIVHGHLKKNVWSHYHSVCMRQYPMK